MFVLSHYYALSQYFGGIIIGGRKLISKTIFSHIYVVDIWGEKDEDNSLITVKSFIIQKRHNSSMSSHPYTTTPNVGGNKLPPRVHLS